MVLVLLLLLLEMLMLILAFDLPFAHDIFFNTGTVMPAGGMELNDGGILYNICHIFCLLFVLLNPFLSRRLCSANCFFSSHCRSLRLAQLTPIHTHKLRSHALTKIQRFRYPRSLTNTFDAALLTSHQLRAHFSCTCSLTRGVPLSLVHQQTPSLARVCVCVRAYFSFSRLTPCKR